MSSRNPEEELAARLDALRLAASAERPSPGIEARLLEAFRRRQPAASSGHERAAEETPPWRPRVSADAWLAVAASLVLTVSAAVGWRSSPQRPAAVATRAGSRSGGERTVLAAAAVRPGLLAPAVVRTTRTAAEGNGAPSVEPRVAPTVAGDGPVEFVAWPGAGALPSLESGELVRMELPAAVVPLLGLAGEPRTRRATVPADVIVGQDGRPRAVRLVSDER